MRPGLAPPGRPASDEYAPFYAPYVALVEGDVLALLAEQPLRLREVVSRVPARFHAHGYAPGKWTLGQVLGHLAETERIFATRLLRIARGDPSPQPSFDENVYVQAGGFEAHPVADLLAWFEAERAASLALVRLLPPEAWTRRGTASGNAVSARALAYLLAGHVAHHTRILAERYAESSLR